MPTLRTSAKLKLAYVGLAATDTWLSGQTHAWAHRARFVTKPLLMPTLAGSLATDPRAVGSPLRTSTLAAQLGGWGGDVALLGGGIRPFVAGTGAFGLGHLAYLSGFLRHRGSTPVAAGWGPRTVAGSWVATAPFLALMARRQHQELGRPVLGYATVLAAMVAAATHLDVDLSPTSRRLTAAGASLFMLSDSMLGMGKFVLPNAPAGLETAVMATYTAGQFLLSEGAARA